LARLIVCPGCPVVADEERGCLLGRVAVVVLENMGVGLEEESNRAGFPARPYVG
jgi:hypothetical protein